MNKRNFAAASLPMLLFLTLLVPCGLQAGFDFDDLEKVEQSEQEELLEAARKAAKGWNFGEAEGYLKQARQKAYAPDDIASVEKLIADNRQAYAAEQERRRQEEERRRRAEEARIAAQQRGSYGGGSGSGSPSYVIVSANFGSPNCYVEKFTLSGGSGQVSSNGSSSATIMKGYDGTLAGTYSYSAKTSCGQYCSGSFRVSGTNGNVNINLTSSCDAYVSEH